MKKITMLTVAASAAGQMFPGKVYSVSDDEHDALVKGGFATSAETTPEAKPEPIQQGVKAEVVENHAEGVREVRRSFKK